MATYYLAHHGVKGMKWGVRKKDDYVKRTARGHAGPGNYATRNRQLAGDKRDLEGMNKGQHLSYGVTKKRQAAYDARDKAALEKRITKNEGQTQRKPYTAQQRSNLKKARNNALITAGVGAAFDAAGVAMKRTKGASYAERYLRGAGGLVMVAGLSSAIIQQGRLRADDRLREAQGKA